MDFPSVIELVSAALIMLAASTVYTALGFGIGMVALPLLLLVFDSQTSIVLSNTTALPLILLILRGNREKADVRRMIPIGIASLIGAALGAWVLASADDRPLRLAILVLILIFTVTTVFKIEFTIPFPKVAGPSIGFVVGLLITGIGIGGPLLALYLLSLKWNRQKLRASLVVAFSFLILSATVGYALGGQYTVERLILLGAAFVPAMIGYFLGSWIIRTINERVFRAFAVGLILVSSLIVLGQEVSKF